MSLLLLPSKVCFKWVNFKYKNEPIATLKIWKSGLKLKNFLIMYSRWNKIEATTQMSRRLKYNRDQKDKTAETVK